ncbi:MAG: VOC family protein [Lysobacter sp.]|nr:VOC family protein [Lysobacter sp.]
MESSTFLRIDHLAIAVQDLEEAILFYRDTLKLPLVERRETMGKYSGMRSAVMSAGNFQIVLIEGTSPESQVSRYVNEYGPGVQHVAFEVENIDETHRDLARNGLEFSTSVLDAPGLRQTFSKRDKVSGMMFELIERTGETGFKEANINRLFEELERADAY